MKIRLEISRETLLILSRQDWIHNLVEKTMTDCVAKNIHPKTDEVSFVKFTTISFWLSDSLIRDFCLLAEKAGITPAELFNWALKRDENDDI